MLKSDILEREIFGVRIVHGNQQQITTLMRKRQTHNVSYQRLLKADLGMFLDLFFFCIFWCLSLKGASLNETAMEEKVHKYYLGIVLGQTKNEPRKSLQCALLVEKSHIKNCSVIQRYHHWKKPIVQKNRNNRKKTKRRILLLGFI